MLMATGAFGRLRAWAKARLPATRDPARPAMAVRRVSLTVIVVHSSLETPRALAGRVQELCMRCRAALGGGPPNGLGLAFVASEISGTAQPRLHVDVFAFGTGCISACRDRDVARARIASDGRLVDV